jgi:GNAT-family acetyltransferase (TIGR03103 family)
MPDNKETKPMLNVQLERNPMDPQQMVSLQHWMSATASTGCEGITPDTLVDCGWGRLIFGQTFGNPHLIVDALRHEQPGKRDIALYLRDPHVLVAQAPQDLFIDPSFTFRLGLSDLGTPTAPEGWLIRPVRLQDADAVRRIYQSRNMVPLPRAFIASLATQAELEMLVAQDSHSQAIIGVVMGVDHVEAFNDPDGGASLWALAVDLQAHHRGIGEGLTKALAHLYRLRGRMFLDLSVLHSNQQAIGLYERLGFTRVPVYCVKMKNPINEPLFVGPDPAADLNVYAGILVQEARRRGIGVDVLDAEAGYFKLTLGGRAITCRESLTELTSAIAMSRCDDKRLTLKLLRNASICVPEQVDGDDDEAVQQLLARHGRVVVKPVRGEQGQGVRVDLTTLDDVHQAIADARQFSSQVIVEQMVQGQDLRIVVIDHHVVAAAIRVPATVVGDGVHDLRQLIERQSRRRQMATAGESRIPIDAETERCLGLQGLGYGDVPPAGARIQVRKTANLHTGGTIHDVTSTLHPVLQEAAERASRLLDIPVVGFDFMVPDPSQADYVVIEANERPGLANHEPQPTAEKFIDLLFPQTRRSGAAAGAPASHDA